MGFCCLVVEKQNSYLEKHPPKQLPYTTSSICPECLYSLEKVNVIEAFVFEEDGKIWISKSCDRHGYFRDIYWSDATLFRKVMKYWYRSIPLHNPRTVRNRGCPYDCGPCPNHFAQTALGLIDVTNRCNMQCPICFASASNPVIYEPSPEQVLEMLKNLRGNLPGPTAAVQFAGGEPTLSENLIDYVRWSNELGFRHIMVATNGLRFARNPDFLRQLVDVGLKTIYLQFDGVTEKPYLEMRGKDYRDMKDKVLDSARYANLDGVILVPTVAKGVNDDQLGDIIDYAITNRDIVRCINFQPVSITGRIDQNDRDNIRITIPDAIHLIENQTKGGVKVSDWYPVSSMNSVGRALGLLRGEHFFELHSHFACGMATFLFINDDGSYVPITDVIDLDNLLETLEDICNLYADKKTLAGLRSKLKLIGLIRKIKRKSFMKPLISSFLKKGSYSSLRAFMNKVLMLGMMHFQDAWNMDLERAQHCTINYATPDGRIISFCTYNNIHRKTVEERFSTSQLNE
ncbi:radical SAM protein [Candidatus Thorarchaeota archaeon]|nr:MAG: radical SAM protein [Candidatus Thorarchaeota archaeon]